MPSFVYLLRMPFISSEAISYRENDVIITKQEITTCFKNEYLRGHDGQACRADLTAHEVKTQRRIARVLQIRHATPDAILVLHVGVFELIVDALFEHLGQVFRITST